METFDLSKLTRRKPNMTVTVDPNPDYEQKAIDLAKRELLRHGLHQVCVDIIRGNEVTKDNWVTCAENMILDTLFWEGIGL